MTAAIRKIVIVGGGTAGWMSAAVLARLIPSGVSVTLVESEEIGTVGVGEATIPSLRDFLRMLDIDEDAFVRATGATFKLGIEFVDWRAAGTRYMHPFGTFGRDVGGVGFSHVWRQQSRQGGAAGDLEDYCLSGVAARLGKFTRPSANPASVLASLNYAFHFDAGRFAAFLRSLAEAGGVRRVEGRIETVETDQHDGRITHVVLADGRRLDGELFIDCSGFRSLLLGGALEVPFVSWQHWLPNDRAVAAASAALPQPPPFTQAIAGRSGWRWRIPLQHRTGNGHVYASAFIDDETAQAELLAGLDGATTTAARPLRFTAGVRERLWERNCVAIGLSGGFLEPLESTSIHLIQTGIARLLGLFPDTGFAAPDRDEYNRVMQREFAQVRDFIILHYKATERGDSPYWRYLRTMDVPDTLAARIDLWREKGRVTQDGGELFTPHSWIAVLHGQAPPPRVCDPIAATLPVEESARFLAHLRDVIGKTALAMPDHATFIAQHCAAPMTRTPGEPA